MVVVVCVDEEFDDVDDEDEIDESDDNLIFFLEIFLVLKTNQ